MLNLLWLLLGVSALIVALTLAWLLLRVGRTLTSVEELLETTTAGLQHTLPEMTQTIGNVNAITAGVNVGLHAAARGASRAGDNVRATWYGMKVAGRSLWRSYMDGTGEMAETQRSAAAGPRAPLAGRRAPLAGPRAPLAGPRAPLAGPRGGSGSGR